MIVLKKKLGQRICARNPQSTAITRTAKDLNIYFSLTSKCETNVSRNMIFVYLTSYALQLFVSIQFFVFCFYKFSNENLCGNVYSAYKIVNVRMELNLAPKKENRYNIEDKNYTLVKKILWQDVKTKKHYLGC